MKSNDPFIIGVEQQPASSFQMWKTLGIDTLVNIPNDPANPNTPEQDKAWVDAANDAGLNQIRKPVGDLREDAKNFSRFSDLPKDGYNKRLLAWCHDDEPDLKGTPPDALLKRYADSVAFGVPWMLNVSGGIVLDLVPTPKMGAKEYAPYMSAADWISSDIYPVAGWNRNIDLFSVGLCIDRLRSWNRGKPQLAYVECSKQNLAWLPDGGNAPTVDEVACIIRQALWQGCKGIIFFPQSLAGNGQPYKNDNTTPEMKNFIAGFCDTYREMNP